MAKAASPSPARKVKVPAKTAKPKISGAETIEKANQEALNKLRTLGIEQELQNEIEWCLGSYRADRNPVGLYTMAERALAVFQTEKSKNTKGITAKLITDIEKALKTR